MSSPKHFCLTSDFAFSSVALVTLSQLEVQVQNGNLPAMFVFDGKSLPKASAEMDILADSLVALMPWPFGKLQNVGKTVAVETEIFALTDTNWSSGLIILLHFACNP